MRAILMRKAGRRGGWRSLEHDGVALIEELPMEVEAVYSGHVSCYNARYWYHGSLFTGMVSQKS